MLKSFASFSATSGASFAERCGHAIVSAPASPEPGTCFSKRKTQRRDTHVDDGDVTASLCDGLGDGMSDTCERASASNRWLTLETRTSVTASDDDAEFLRDYQTTS